MKKQALLCLAVLLMLTLFASSVWAQGAWVFVEANDDGTPRALNNPQWKYEVDCKGLSHKGLLSSDAWKRKTAGSVSWGGAPPKNLVPGATYTATANLSVRDIKGTGNDKSVCHIAQGIWRKDGSFVNYGGKVPESPKWGRADKPADKPSASSAWSGEWTVPQGSEGLFLRVEYVSSMPGGGCRTTYVYRWDPSASAAAPDDQKAPPLKVSLKAERTSLNLGDRIPLSAEVSGGKPPYSYLWNGKTRTKGGKVHYQAKKTGKRTITVEVSDSAGQKASSRLTFTVADAVQTPELTVTLDTTQKSVPVNGKLMVEALAKGGRPPYTYLWQKQTSTTESRVDITMPEAGKKWVVVEVSDSDGKKAQATLQVTVTEQAAVKPAELQVKLVSTPAEDTDKTTKVLVHHLVTVRAVASGGSGQYEYTWSGDRGWTRKSSTTVTYVASYPQEPNLSVQVRDKVTGQQASDWLKIRVMGVKGVLTLAGPPKNQIPVGKPVAFTVTVTNQTFKNGDELFGKPLYVLWQPHPEVEFRDFEGNCSQMKPCGMSTWATFSEPGPKTVWAELMAVDGPEKILVGEATMEVNVVP